MSDERHAGKYYWVRFYRDNADWEPAELYKILEHGAEIWARINSEVEWYHTEVNEVGLEIIPPSS